VTGDVSSIRDALRLLDGMNDRVTRLVLDGPARRSRADDDGRTRLGRITWELGTTAMAVAVDHGHAWRLLIEGDDLPTFAHFTILRSVGEAAVTARWLVDEAADAQERARRAWGAQQQDLVERGRMEDLITRDGFDLPRGQGLLAKERMADLDAEARHAGVIPRKPLGVTDLFARYATPPDADLLGTGEALYRLLSAIAHGKPWALVPMARREWPAEEPSAGPVRLSIQLEVAALLTRNVLSLARAALRDVESYGGLSTTGHRFPGAP
jgi:hypothetical protein